MDDTKPGLRHPQVARWLGHADVRTPEAFLHVDLSEKRGASKAALPPDVKARVMALGGRHVTADGVLIVASRANRSQAENRRAARARLGRVQAAVALPLRRYGVDYGTGFAYGLVLQAIEMSVGVGVGLIMLAPGRA